MSLLLTVLDGRITLKGILGMGGMGEVHRAWDAGLERPVAVKFVRGGDPKEADRLLLEARLQARVEHPHVVRVHDTGTLEGRPCIVFQLVEGQTYADLRTEVGWRAKVELAVEAARGLGAAHRMGLVHRDVKPANILVENTETGLKALLSDFGLARDEEGGLTRSGLLMGTVDFMAPEQVTGAAPVDYRADIYGLGATLYAVLAGRPPFRDSARSTAPGRNTEGLEPVTEAAEVHPGDLLRRVLEEDPKPLSTEVPGLPKDLSVVIAKAMEKEPAQRYATADALADDLNRVLQGEPVLARSVSWLERGARWTQRNPIPARVVGAGLLTIMAATGFGFWNSRRSTLAALDAAQMGGEAKALELRLRTAYLAPAHDLGSVMAELRQGVIRLEGHAGAAGAASNYARGRVFLLLDELREARTALETARAQGFQGQGLEEALGLVYGRLYDQDLPKAEALQDDSLRAERLAELDHDLKNPALAHLRSAGFTLYQQAFSSLLQQRFEEARSLARGARDRDPEMAEATLLEVQTWLREGRSALNLQDLDRAQVCASQGWIRGQGLLGDLRSDPAVPVVLAQLKGLQAGVSVRRGMDASRDFGEGQVLVNLALALDRDSYPALLARALLLEKESSVSVDAFREDSPRKAEALVVACQHLVTLAPRRAEGHVLLAAAYHHRGFNEARLGLDPTGAYRKGRQEGEAAYALEPWNPEGLRHACLNAMAEATFRVENAKESGEAMGAAETLFQHLSVARGLNPLSQKELQAELLFLQGRSAWFQGKDPDPFMEQGFALYEALLGAAPDAPVPLVNLAHAAGDWAALRWTSGRDISPVLGRTMPALERGILRWPSHRALLLINRCQLLVLEAFGPSEEPVTLQGNRAMVEARSAVHQAMAAARHPLLPMALGYIHLAQGLQGLPGAGDRACVLVEPVFKTFPSGASPRFALAVALRLRGRPGDLARALGLLDDAQETARLDPEWGVYRAMILAAMGRMEEATRQREKALARQPLLAGHPVWAIWPRGSERGVGNHPGP